MKKYVLTITALFLLNSCVWQNMPDWKELPGEKCTLKTTRRSLVRKTNSSNAGEKAVKLRESEEEKLRHYLQKFTEETPEANKAQHDANKLNMQGEQYATTQTVLNGQYFTLTYVADEVILSIGKKERKQYVRKATAKDTEILSILRKRSDSRALRQ